MAVWKMLTKCKVTIDIFCVFGHSGCPYWSFGDFVDVGGSGSGFLPVVHSSGPQ